MRDDRSTAAFVVQNSVTTWQAYNLWGGYDLYEGKNGSGGSDFDHRARVVSFDRPYSMGAGSGDFLGNEFPLVSLVESLGLDVTYWTDVDLHERAELLTRHRALLTLGHDEYWSRAMRTGAEQARDQGVNIAFFGANAVFRHVRLEPSHLGPDRQQVDYKRPHEDPLFGKDNKDVTSDWRAFPVSEPESTLIGNLYECNPVKADMVVADPAAWMFAGTGLSKGDRLKQLVGPEYDRYDPTVPGPKNVQVMAHSPLRCGGKSSYSDMTYYTAPSGGGVWASGTNWWISKLSEECTPSTLSAPTTTSSSTTTTFPAAPSVTRTSSSPAICPKQAVVKITENILNLFGVGPAGRTQPSAPTNLRDLPSSSSYIGSTDVPTTQYRQRTRTTVTSSYYYPSNTVATEPPYSPTTPTRPQYTTPTRRGYTRRTRVTPSRMVSITHSTLGSEAMKSLSLDDGASVGAGVVGDEHRPAPQDVVDRDHAALRELGQDGLVVAAVAGLVGVDEDEIEGTVEGGERLEGGPHADLDPVPPRAGLDVAPGEGFVLGADLERDELPVGGEGGRHRHGRVPREGPDLEDLPRSGHGDQHSEERALEVAGEHPRHPAERPAGLLGHCLQLRRLGGGVLGGVALDIRVDDLGHALSVMDNDEARQFLRENHHAVMCTLRQSGDPAMSPIAVAVDDEGYAVISSRETAYKVKHLRRDPRAWLCVLRDAFYPPWILIEGRATVVSLPDAMEGLVEYYRRVAGEHPDWDDYRQAMEREKRVLIRIAIERVGPQQQG